MPTMTADNTNTKEKRFSFGQNWSNFLQVLDEHRILEAEKSLKEMLKVESLKGMRFLDIGSGSGLFSLAARRLGADVFSFDYDPKSVGCTQFLRDKYFPEDTHWKAEQGSALDETYVTSLGQFDIVYSWGVLHHTGNMWKALEIASKAVKPRGELFIALYNDQGFKSRFWWHVKHIYCSGIIGEMIISSIFLPFFTFKNVVKSIVRGRNEFKAYKSSRGMSIFHDDIDWIGGFPFEVASVEAIKNFYTPKGFSLINLKTTNSWGNNEFVFQKNA